MKFIYTTKNLRILKYWEKHCTVLFKVKDENYKQKHYVTASCTVYVQHIHKVTSTAIQLAN